MSFRLRVLVLIMYVAVTATAATTWLTLRQASRQIEQSVAASQQEALLITEQLRAYGLNHGTWDGVATEVRDLARRTGQRIRVVTDSGRLLADSDILAGGAPRHVVGAPLLIDARPTLRLQEGRTPAVMARLTILAIHRFREGAPYAACLTRAGGAVTVSLGSDGVPVYASVPSVTGCIRTPPPQSAVQADSAAALACTSLPADKAAECLGGVFSQQIGGLAPEPAQAYLGAADQPAPSLEIGPTVAVAAAVAAVSVLGALALSRRVLRPVSTLTRASRRLGAGDLSQRVPVSGRDEMAELARSFNRMADSLQASEERQRHLIGDVAHELRAPVANLRGYLEALRDGVVDPDPALLSSLHDEVLLQQRIIEDLQDLALAEAGTLTYHHTDVDMAEVLATCLTAHRPLAAAAGVTLVAQSTGSAIVHADPDRLRQVFGNLVNNAVRATAAGGRVVLACWCDETVVTVRVSDTGSGIATTDLPHVFDRFWRADTARGRTTGGSGLGLAIARQIIADHQGTIEVASCVGVGTTFTVVLRHGDPPG